MKRAKSQMNRDSADFYDCAVIGGGPGGLVAALYLGRFKRKVLLVDSGHSRAQWIPRIRNLIGYNKGLTGMNLLRKLNEQVRQYKIDSVQGEAQVFHLKNHFGVRVHHLTYKARTVILATGMMDHQPPVENIPELRRRQMLAYCPICDGYEHSDEKIGVLISDPHGIKKACFLSRFSKNIFIFQVRPFRLSSRDRKTIEQHGFQIFQGQLESLKLKVRPKRKLWVKMKNHEAIAVDVAYVALGVDFNLKTTARLRGLRKTKGGFIRTSSHQETSIPNLYAVGDCVNALAQVSVAVGQAALAATRIHNTLGF